MNDPPQAEEQYHLCQFILDFEYILFDEPSFGGLKGLLDDNYGRKAPQASRPFVVSLIACF